MQIERPRYIVAGLAFAAISILLFSQFAIAISPSNIASFNQWTTVAGCAYMVFTDGVSYYSKNCDTGAIAFSGSTAATVFQSTFDAVTTGKTVVIREGTYAITNTLTLTKPVVIDGQGGAVLNKASDYAGTSKAIFNIASSDVIIQRLKLLDSIQASATKLVVSQPSTNIRNIVLQDMTIQNAGFQAIVISSTGTSTISNVLIERVIVNSTTNGAGIVIGKGAGSVTIRDSRIHNPGHSAIDIWGCDQFIKIQGNLIDKTTNTAGIGVAITNYRDSDTESGNCKEISVTDNRFLGAIEFDDVLVHGEAEKVVIQRNFMTNAVGRDGVKITFHDLTPDRYAKEVFVKDNIIANAVGHGVSIVSTGTNEFPAFEVSGNYIKEVRKNGIDFTSAVKRSIVSNNMIYNAGLDAVADRAGIHLRITTNTTVYGNQIYLNGSATWSVYEENSSNNNVIFGNNVNKVMSISGASTQLFRNEGYKTENTFQSGTFSINSTGVKTVTTAHGLSKTPAAEDCIAVVLEVTNIDDWAYDWIKQDGIDATNVTFKVKVGTASATSGATARLGIWCVRA